LHGLFLSILASIAADSAVTKGRKGYQRALNSGSDIFVGLAGSSTW